MMSLIWSKDSFRNCLTILVICICFYIYFNKPESESAMMMIIMLVLKWHYDGNKESARKDETINSMANSIPNADNK